MYVRIGKIAQALGVSTHLLKHYEKLGLIQPSKDEESKYRYYDRKQCERILECKKYRNMGMTLKEISQMLNGEYKINASELARKQVEKIEEEIRQLETMRTITQTYYERCNDFDIKCNQWFIEISPWMYFIPMYENDSLINDKGDKEKSEWIESVPLSQQMSYFKEDRKIQRGLCIEKMELEQSEYSIKDSCVELVPQRMITVYLKLSAEHERYEELCKQLKAIYNEFSVEELKEMYLIYIKKEYKEQKEYDCVKAYIPLKDECKTLVSK